MSNVSNVGVNDHRVVSREEWLSERTAFLAKEKEFTRLRDELSRERRRLPWVRIDKEYAFDTPAGRQTLADLFEGRSQLVVYHFMFNPSWDEGCKSCSFWADHFDGAAVHLNHRDVALVAASRAPLAKIEAFRKKMGWKFNWVSSSPGDFNDDFHVSFKPATLGREVFYNYRRTRMDMEDREGLSVFFKDAAGTVYHTYSCYARGIDLLNGTYNFLDLVPRGRDEDGFEFPQEWVQYHDRYKD